MKTGDAAGFRVVVVSDINEVGHETWNSCLDVSCDSPHPANPFVTFEFLAALEASSCVCATTGWLPQHLCLKDSDDRTLA
ncbi:MAG: peptidogalycan biosysnthesis protein, partial [Hyphomicrobiales bacterium]